MESNGLGKLLPKSISAKRRRKKQPSIADTTTSSNDEAGLERGRSTLSRQTTDSLNGNQAGEEGTSLVSNVSDAES